MPERHAYICRHKDCVPPWRVFLAAGEPSPRCPEHGREMARQVNLKYVRPVVTGPVGKSQTR